MTEHFQDLLGKILEYEHLNVGSSTSQKEVVIDVLKKLVDQLKAEQCRTVLAVDDIKRLCKLLKAFNVVPKEGASETYSDKSVDGSVCAECLRSLRNACVQNEENQNQIGQSGAVECIKDLVARLCSAEMGSNESNRTQVRCAVQLAGNLVCGNSKTSALVWRELFPQSLLHVFSYDDLKASVYCCMLLNECLTDDARRQQLMKQPDGHCIIEAVLRLCEQETQHDFSLQIMQSLVTSSNFMLSTYDRLSTAAKITVLDILAALLSQSEGPTNDTIPTSSSVPLESSVLASTDEWTKKDTGVPVFTIAYLAEQFEELTKSVRTFMTEEQNRVSTEQKTFVLIMRLLTVLAIAASNHDVYRQLQERESLLQISLELLEKAHLSIKRSDPLPSTPNDPSNPAGDSETSPVYGLKRDLVRLIGNLCYRHKNNQNKIRELHGIPLILDHCNIDNQNPYISQWAILSIRNLCEDNQENQDFISAMANQGAAPSTDFLRGMGVNVDMRDGVPYIKTSSKNK